MQFQGPGIVNKNISQASTSLSPKPLCIEINSGAHENLKPRIRRHQAYQEPRDLVHKRVTHNVAIISLTLFDTLVLINTLVFVNDVLRYGNEI